MNENIRDALVKSGMPNEDIMDIFNDVTQLGYMNNFAEHIVRDCANKLDTLDDSIALYSLNDGRAVTKSEWLLRQFGIRNAR